MNYYNYTLESYKLEEMKMTIQEFVMASEHIFQESEQTEQTLSNIKYVDTVKGISIYYCYGTDTFMFTDETN